MTYQKFNLITRSFSVFEKLYFKKYKPLKYPTIFSTIFWIFTIFK